MPLCIDANIVFSPVQRSERKWSHSKDLGCFTPILETCAQTCPQVPTMIILLHEGYLPPRIWQRQLYCKFSSRVDGIFWSLTNKNAVGAIVPNVMDRAHKWFLSCSSFSCRDKVRLRELGESLSKFGASSKLHVVHWNKLALRLGRVLRVVVAWPYMFTLELTCLACVHAKKTPSPIYDGNVAKVSLRKVRSKLHSYS